MGRVRFVQPSRVRLHLTEGDWIDVKKNLSYGETVSLQGAAMTAVEAKTFFGGGDGSDDGMARIDVARGAVEVIHTWLLDWSFKDNEDRPVKITRDAIRALDAETAGEIHSALSRHMEDVAEEKKAATTTSSPETK